MTPPAVRRNLVLVVVGLLMQLPQSVSTIAVIGPLLLDPGAPPIGPLAPDAGITAVLGMPLLGAGVVGACIASIQPGRTRHLLALAAAGVLSFVAGGVGAVVLRAAFGESTTVANVYPAIGPYPEVLLGMLTLAALPGFAMVDSLLVLGGAAFAGRSVAALVAELLRRRSRRG